MSFGDRKQSGRYEGCGVLRYGFFLRVGNAYDMETKRNADRELWRLVHVI